MEGSKRGGHRGVLSEIFVALFADMDTLTRYRSDNGFVGTFAAFGDLIEFLQSQKLQQIMNA